MRNDLDIELPAIAAGDADAFGRWLSGAEAELRRALRPFAARVDVEAVLQEGLLRTWQVAPRLEADGKPNALLRFAIVASRNLAVSEARKLSPIASLKGHDNEVDDATERTLERLSALSHSGDATPDPFLRRAIIECHEKLPAKPAQALAQRLQSAGGEHDEVLAERLGMRLNTFLQNFTRARKLLAHCLEARGIDLWREL
jgi:DNA-directed RNA polymerase specialized sigma24 family protein